MGLTEQCQKKNHYFVQTIKREIEHFNAISFGIFDVVLLGKVLFPNDILRICSKKAKEENGIQDFGYIRANVEIELRNATAQMDNLIEDVSLTEVYSEISRRYPGLPCDKLMEDEISVQKESYCVNPLIKDLIDYALERSKKVMLIDDSRLNENHIRTILKETGVDERVEVYVSADSHKTKGKTLFQYIAEKSDIAYESWLHIGCNLYTDMEVPRSLGITAGYFRCPRDWYTIEKAQEGQITGTSEALFDVSLENSMAISDDINVRFTKTLGPSDEVCVSAENISMMFNMSSEKVDNLKEYVIRMVKRQLMFKEFWALKDVSFEVRHGEKVALIGHNGSGKSTMLKIAAGVLKPTSGKIRVSGSIAPMIELGAGFDMELSARENVYLNSAILGLTREETDRYYDSIIEFAELAEFQDIAIKNFSSGMMARLGFAIATCRAPDVLIIDEVLAVGDFSFQEKCKKKMNELTGEGTTVLFVSHSAADVINLCDRAVWLEHGKVMAEGEAQYIMEKYLYSAKGEK